ncbi:NS2 protein [Tribec virus]|nr:NS2 protein [Tribec virus]
MSSEKQTPPMIKKPFTRTIVLKSEGKDDFVARMCSTLECEYVVVKHGVGTHVVGSNTPIHGCLLVVIPNAGSYRLIDRDQSTFLVVSRDGIEVQQDRWPGMRFEAVDMYPRACKIRFGTKENDSEVRFGKASGNVPPYTPDNVTDDQEEFTLPGVCFHTPEEELREYRERLREEKELRTANILEVFRSTQQSRSLGRIHGIRNSDLTALKPAVPPPVRRSASITRVSDEIDRTPTPPKPTLSPIPNPSRGLGIPSAIPSVKKTIRPADIPPVESEELKFVPEYERIAEAAFESLLEDNSSLGLQFGGKPERIGMFSQNLGAYEIDPLSLPVYEIDAAKNRYKCIGTRTSTQLNALVCDGRVYFVPGAN